MADVCNEMLEQPCGTVDDKMASTYEIDYKRRGLHKHFQVGSFNLHPVAIRVSSDAKTVK